MLDETAVTVSNHKDEVDSNLWKLFECIDLLVEQRHNPDTADYVLENETRISLQASVLFELLKDIREGNRNMETVTEKPRLHIVEYTQTPLRKIVTHAEFPPIPTNKFDWVATYDDYDADCDERGFFSNCPIGHGSTEGEAVADLIANAEDK